MREGKRMEAVRNREREGGGESAHGAAVMKDR